MQQNPRQRCVAVCLPAFCLMVLTAWAVGAFADTRPRLVACAPGYPGTAEQAQPLMDRFAEAVAKQTGFSFVAGYDPGFETGTEAIRDAGTALALVPLSFYLERKAELELTPLLSVAYETGATERWALVAAKGRVPDATALQDWRLTATPGYSSKFVRAVALADWEALPDTVSIEPSARVLSDLRKAARGEDLAVLLDRAQTDALPKLPFADELEIVARSGEMPAYLLCEVAGRLGAARREVVRNGWVGLHQEGETGEAMQGIRIERFLPLDKEGVTEIERRFATAP